MIQNYRHMLYSFRRQYGKPVRLYRSPNRTVNYDTGETKYNYSMTLVRDCVMLPLKAAWHMFPKNLSSGFVKQVDELEVADTAFYVDAAYGEVDLESLLEINNLQYKVIEVHKLDIYGYLIAAKATNGPLLGHLFSVVDIVSLGEGNTYEHVTD